jgi:hypothetical protein
MHFCTGSCLSCDRITIECLVVVMDVINMMNDMFRITDVPQRLSDN